MSERAPYSRVYWSVVDDEKFVAIYDDNHHLATWLRLLIVADQAYPASAPLPYGCRKASIAALVEAGLVDLGTGNRYRVHGLEAERERRKVAATSRGPNGTRTVTERSPNGPDTTGLSQAEPSLAKTSRAESPREDPADGYWSLTGRYPKDAALSWIDRLTETYGAPATIAALAKAHITDRSVNTLLGRTEDVLRADARQLDLKERAAEKARVAEKRSQPRVVDAWKDDYRRALEERYGDYAT